MYSDHGRRILDGNIRGDAGAEIPASGAISLIAKSLHERMPQPCDSAVVCLCRSFREAVSRKRGNDEVESRRVDTVGFRVGQKWHKRQKFEKRARPSMGQDQRDAVSLPRPFVYEVNVDGAEFSTKVLERVQPALLRPPVEAVGPVAKKALQVLEVGPLRPCGARRLIRPARVTDPRSQVG